MGKHVRRIFLFCPTACNRAGIFPCLTEIPVCTSFCGRESRARNGGGGGGGEGRERDKRPRKVRGRFTSRLYPSFRGGKKHLAKHLCEIRFFFLFLFLFFFYSDLPLSNSFSKTHLHFPDLSTANYARRFYPIIRTAQKRVTREIVRINSLMSEGSGFCQTIPDTMPRTGLRLIDFYNTGCRLKSFLDRSGVRLFSVCKKVGLGQACSYARLLCKLGFFPLFYLGLMKL